MVHGGPSAVKAIYPLVATAYPLSLPHIMYEYVILWQKRCAMLTVTRLKAGARRA